MYLFNINIYIYMYNNKTELNNSEYSAFKSQKTAPTNLIKNIGI